MSNIFWEVTLAFVGFIILINLIKKEKNFSMNMLIVFFFTYFVDIIIVLLSPRGAMYFGDGYDYYQYSLGILRMYGKNISTFIEIDKFIHVIQSWHFVPVWEFTLFEALFGSTKCISIFHIFLMHNSFIIWNKIFIKLGLKKSGKVATIFLILSLYLQNFTIPALKDPLIFYLVAIISLRLLNFYNTLLLKELLYTIVPLLILTYSRMYCSFALIVVMFILLIRYIKINYNRKHIIKSIVLPLVLLVALLTIGGKILQSEIYIYASGWIKKTDFKFISIFVTIIKRIFEFCFGPLIFNIGSAQSLYYLIYLEALVRTIGFWFLLKGLILFINYKEKSKFVIILILPMIICMVALETGQQLSASRQYMPFYPILCIVYAIGISGLDDNKNEIKKEETS